LPRYSHRLSWSLEPNPLSLAIAQKQKSGAHLLDLTISNPTHISNYPHSQIAAALSAVRDFRYHPDPFGLPGAREGVAGLYRELGLDIPVSRIALAASTSEAYALLFKLLCDPGDEILIPTPSYPLFEYLAALENVRTVPYRLAYDGAWHIDFAHLRRQISDRSRAIVLVNPNNPTGSFLKKWECDTLFALAAEHDLPLISDEVFLHFEFGSDPARVRTLASFPHFLSFSLNGLSKTAAMPQMKLAWIVLNGPAADVERARQRLELLLDTYLSVNTPVQLALPALLEIGDWLRSEIRARTGRNLRTCRQALSPSAAHPLHAEGGWSVILQFPQTRSEEEWIELLLGENVLLQPGYFFDLHGGAYAVASLLPDPEIFAEAMQRIAKLLAIA